MNNCDFYNVFFTLAKLSKDCIENGIINTKIEKICGNFSYEYLEGVLDLLKNAMPLESINFYFDYKISEIKRFNDLSEFEIKELYIIKHAFLILYNLDKSSLNNFIFFSRQFLDYDNYQKIRDYLN
ncbi:MAG: hypothetical protein RR898_10580 [Clostridium sp.]|uniref:hypothetical protein n=1 Tax=Clostridium sp. TaxID=1506 RepID=UPI002FC67DA8